MDKDDKKPKITITQGGLFDKMMTGEPSEIKEPVIIGKMTMDDNNRTFREMMVNASEYDYESALEDLEDFEEQMLLLSDGLSPIDFYILDDFRRFSRVNNEKHLEYYVGTTESMLDGELSMLKSLRTTIRLYNDTYIHIYGDKSRHTARIKEKLKKITAEICNELTEYQMHVKLVTLDGNIHFHFIESDVHDNVFKCVMYYEINDEKNNFIDNIMSPTLDFIKKLKFGLNPLDVKIEDMENNSFGLSGVDDFAFSSSSMLVSILLKI